MEKTVEFHIAAGDAVFTLNEFSRQSGLQLLFDYNEVRGRTTRAIDGEFEPAAALRRMLADTGLVFDFVNERTLTITPAARVRSGQAAPPQIARGAPVNPAIPPVQDSKPDRSGSAEPAIDGRSSSIEEVLVTGTHVTGGSPVGEHVIVLNRDDIDSSGAATLQDFMRTLPQTFGGGPTEDTHIGAEAMTNSGLGTGVNLRGLGARSTLVLLDGRRLAPGGSEAEFVDIESIPLSAIERIDILPDGASALYGSDAVGGVVNYVMRDGFTGAESTFRAGSGTSGSLKEYLVAQTLGSQWNCGNAMLSVEFYRRDSLPASARRYANSDLVSLGGGDFDSLLANPGNLVVGNQTYAIPHGQNGTQLEAGALHAGTENRQNLYEDADLLPRQERWSLFASGAESPAAAVRLFVTALISHRDARERTGGFGTDLTVPDSNPFYVNPRGGTAPVVVDYNFLEDLGPQIVDTAIDTLNFTLGASAELESSWKLSLSASYARENQDQYAGGQVNFPALQAALADSDPATAFNPFGDGSHSSPATLAAISSSSRFYTDSQLRSAEFTADGPLMRLPAGSVLLAVGADRRVQSYSSLEPTSVIAPATRNNASRDVTAGFGELKIPVLGSDGARRQELELSLAARVESYSDFGSGTAPKVGVLWSPVEAIALRGTWSKSVRAPTLADLNEAHNVAIEYVLPDSAAPGGATNVLVWSGKNAALSMEHARNWTAGLDLKPDTVIPGVAASLTYFDVLFRDRIQSPMLTGDFLDEPGLAPLVTRNPSTALLTAVCNQSTYLQGTAADCAHLPVGALIDLRLHNVGRVSTRGFDLLGSFEHAFEQGRLRLSLSGTDLLRFSQAQTAASPVMNVLDTQNNPIDLRLRATVGWQRRAIGMSAAVNFQNHYRDTADQPARRVDSFTTIDLQLRYDMGMSSGSWLANTRFTLNALNLFNVSPPFLNNRIAGLGYDQENADPLGRQLSLQVRKSW
ncbi:MAG TPA: TonB-dependent receptor [Steroidobacteraceae bacterium]|nr:TonB-dependent receptor [Steroidobacteraceae bacterium]